MTRMREPSLLDRLLGHFGYEKYRPNAATVPAIQPEAVIAPPLPSHRIAQAGFDYARAELGSMSFSYSGSGDWFSYAVGKDDWVPVAIGGILLGNAREEALELIKGYARDAMWLDPQSAEFSAWIKANDAVFEQIATIESEPRAGIAQIARSSGQGWPEKFGFMDPREVSFQYRLCWKRTHVEMKELFLSASEAHAEFCRLPDVRQVTVILDAHIKNLTGLVEYWFETRGYTVDRNLHLVKVNGYEALFYSAEQAY